MPSFSAALLLAMAAVAPASHADTITLSPFMQTGRTVQAVINGQAGTFLFDTGGGLSIITPAFAGRIGCQPWGQLTGHQMSGKRLDAQRCNDVTVRFGGMQVQKDGIGVFDFQKLLPPDAPHVDGSLALDLFDDKVVTFSQTQNRLTVLDAVPAALERCASVPVHLVRETEGFSLTVSLPVRTPAGTAWFELDSGNTSPYTLVSKTLAASLSMRPVLQEAQTVALRIGDTEPARLQAIVLDLIIDGNLGTNFLAGHDVTIDLKTRRAWLVPPASSACRHLTPVLLLDVSQG